MQDQRLQLYLLMKEHFFKSVSCKGVNSPSKNYVVRDKLGILTEGQAWDILTEGEHGLLGNRPCEVLSGILMDK